MLPLSAVCPPVSTCAGGSFGDVALKTCTKCGQKKALSDFNSDRSNADGKYQWCKTCWREHYAANRERILSQQSAYRAANHEKEQARHAAYYEANREKVAARKAAYQVKNREKRSVYYAAYNAANRKKITAYNTEYSRVRRKTDPAYALTLRLRCRLLAVLGGKWKSASTLKLLGCTIDELKNHLASKFPEGMSFENRNLWHVDHIRPCASFDLTDPEQQRVCFHWTNLQPLWASDNLRKGAKIRIGGTIKGVKR
jgi:hypothetical protein